MLQRLFLTGLLIASFGFAQMGAVTHEISHFAELSLQNSTADTTNNHSSESENNHSQKSHTCEKCVGYNGLGHAVASTSFVLPVAANESQPHTTNAAVTALSTRFNYAARAPPKLV
jgi:hypothetical protein